MSWKLRNWRFLAPVLFVAATVSGCATWINYGDGDLKGRVVIQWAREDKFIYLRTSNPLSFKPSFMNTAIVPDTMYTDGGSIPRIFWSIPGLSPWGLEPAFVVHDWLFQVHRCHRPAPPEVVAITFEQSAQILAEVGKSLVEAGLIENNKLDEIVWAIQTKYARNIWDSPPAPGECTVPVIATSERARLGLAPARTVVDFLVPSPRRR